jgi:hypothetical protein
MNTKNELNKAKNPTKTAKTEAQDLVKKVNNYLELPQKEQPTVATVKDRDQLQDQALKEAVKNGDKILVYAKAQVIVVYRPSVNKVVLFQPLNLTSQADSKASDTSTDPSALTAPAAATQNP